MLMRFLAACVLLWHCARFFEQEADLNARVAPEDVHHGIIVLTDVHFVFQDNVSKTGSSGSQREGRLGLAVLETSHTFTGATTSCDASGGGTQENTEVRIALVEQGHTAHCLHPSQQSRLEAGILSHSAYEFGRLGDAKQIDACVALEDAGLGVVGKGGAQFDVGDGHKRKGEGISHRGVVHDGHIGGGERAKQGMGILAACVALLFTKADGQPNCLGFEEEGSDVGRKVQTADVLSLRVYLMCFLDVIAGDAFHIFGGLAEYVGVSIPEAGLDRAVLPKDALQEEHEDGCFLKYAQPVMAFSASATCGVYQIQTARNACVAVKKKLWNVDWNYPKVSRKNPDMERVVCMDSCRVDNQEASVCDVSRDSVKVGCTGAMSATNPAKKSAYDDWTTKLFAQFPMERLSSWRCGPMRRGSHDCTLGLQPGRCRHKAFCAQLFFGPGQLGEVRLGVALLGGQHGAKEEAQQRPVLGSRGAGQDGEAHRQGVGLVGDIFKLQDIQVFEGMVRQTDRANGLDFVPEAEEGIADEVLRWGRESGQLAVNFGRGTESSSSLPDPAQKRYCKPFSGPSHCCHLSGCDLQASMLGSSWMSVWMVDSGDVVCDGTTDGILEGTGGAARVVGMGMAGSKGKDMAFTFSQNAMHLPGFRKFPNMPGKATPKYERQAIDEF
ncbi:hypothetical protein BDK51DRAFT_27269 [Blyttiomyces helicus]|uniref:Uncharacterized protein n=1 Tax=Blyttiomyces helicus TaxID=388810 RepID=A0A4P9WMB3_9FUNG|nr:hypothetical protein BDK51DRAFT_27269 [Blyttiomyces helicus]|eukprot:RKO92808.1 hypothetical protein BDK51DRAFT_27269 [Blyttiomyces helicus]